MSAALLLLPDFSLILLGAALRRVMHLGDHFWNGVEKLVYFVLFPALLFNGLVRTRIDWQAAGPLIAVAAGAMLTAMALGSGLRLFGLAPRQFASLHQCSFRFNSYIGLAVAGSLHGPAGVAAMAIVVGVMVPPANVTAVYVLARHGEHKVLRELARNPLIIGTVAGLIANLAGLQLPEPALKLLTRLSDAAVALGLLAVGAGLRMQNRQVGAGRTAASAYLLTVKLLAMPLVALGLARWLGLPPLYADIALIFAALPIASSAFILAQRMGGDGPEVAWQISASTLLAMLTMPLWLMVAGH
jgi:malonate transporter